MIMQKTIRYFSNWQMHQWVRAAFGSLFAIAFIVDQQWPYAMFAGIFLLQAFLNKGCTGDSCNIN
jgi:hypothetical protein